MEQNDRDHDEAHGRNRRVPLVVPTHRHNRLQRLCDAHTDERRKNGPLYTLKETQIGVKETKNEKNVY